jgi:hypothetical protein
MDTLDIFVLFLRLRIYIITLILRVVGLCTETEMVPYFEIFWIFSINIRYIAFIFNFDFSPKNSEGGTCLACPPLPDGARDSLPLQERLSFVLEVQYSFTRRPGNEQVVVAVTRLPFVRLVISLSDTDCTDFFSHFSSVHRGQYYFATFNTDSSSGFSEIF